MTTCHLVTRLQATLDRQIDLDHLDHAWRQLVTLSELLLLGFKHAIKLFTLLVQCILNAFHLTRKLFIRNANIKPVMRVHIIQIGGGNVGLAQLLRTTFCGLASQHATHTCKGVFLNNAHLVGQVFLVGANLRFDDGVSTHIALNAFTGKHLHVNDRTHHAGRHTQGRVLHI